MRYTLQSSRDNGKTWEDIDLECKFNNKKQLESFIGHYNQDYEWRVGFRFKHFGYGLCRFVSTKTGEEGRV